MGEAAAAPAPAALITMRAITKRFGPTVANHGVNLDIVAGRVHALLGENGAGKSTLMKILSGLYRPDSGKITAAGAPLRLASPARAIDHGIAMVHQEFMLVTDFTVAENVVLGAEPRKAIWLDRDRAAAEVAELGRCHGLPVDPWARVDDLPVALRQRVEILKALYRRSRVLILDEPTAALGPDQAAALLDVARQLAAQGKAVVLITHKLGEVMAAADWITVMARGKVIAETRPEQTSAAALAELMVGGQQIPALDKGPSVPGQALLKADRLCVRGDAGVLAVKDFSIEVRAGEILGLAGAQGSGQSELAEAITGIRPLAGGRVWLAGQWLVPGSARAFIGAGGGHIPEDRRQSGLVPGHGIADNLVLSRFARPPFGRWGWRDLGAVLGHARTMMARFDIRAAGPRTPAAALSGGNQQKVVLSRELSRDPCFLLANQPTRGLDVAAAAFVLNQLLDLRRRGRAVLLIGLDLGELLAVCDRIAVIHAGQLAGVVDAPTADLGRIGRLMAGVGG